MKKRVVIIGSGFSGFYAARKLAKFKKEIDLIVIDKRDTFDFLPLLPDVIGRNINPQILSNSIRQISRKFGFNFIKDEVISIELENNVVQTLSKKITYDYLIISSGSETNFYGNEGIRKFVYPVNNVRDMEKIMESLKSKEYDHYFISGAGYTGVEVATNLKRYFNKHKIQKDIVIIEKAPGILGSLPEWMKKYVADNLAKLNINILVNASLDKIDLDSIVLSSGQSFNKAFVFWVSGVKTAGFIQNLSVEKNPQGRIKVDAYLKITPNCFVVGDCAFIAYKDSFLRMAVQFSIYEALCAAENIERAIKGKKLKIYKPLDMGYIIPMANNKSCGQVMGIDFKGFLPTLMHFVMCVYRLNGFKNKIGLIKALVKGGFKWQT